MGRHFNCVYIVIFTIWLLLKPEFFLRKICNLKGLGIWILQFSMCLSLVMKDWCSLSKGLYNDIYHCAINGKQSTLHSVSECILIAILVYSCCYGLPLCFLIVCLCFHWTVKKQSKRQLPYIRK